MYNNHVVKLSSKLERHGKMSFEYVYIYIDASSSITRGMNLTRTCEGEPIRDSKPNQKVKLLLGPLWFMGFVEGYQNLMWRAWHARCLALKFEVSF